MAASVWFSVLVIIFIQQVFARDCSNIGSLKNCNECIRCGGTWCNDVSERTRCRTEKDDQWCPTSRAELLPQIYRNQPTNKFFEKSILVGDTGLIEVPFQHTSQEPQVTISVTNSSLQNSDGFVKKYKTKCENGNCATTIIAGPSKNFCPDNGTVNEYVVLKIRADGLNEDIATAKYHVPCACDSTQGTRSKSVEKKSEKCNGQGDFIADDFTIYGCTCYDGWHGISCEENEDGSHRGDNPNCNHLYTNLECSKNGRCNHKTGSCECFTDSEGSQYYDPAYYCENICATSSFCDSCLRNLTLGPCDDCNYVEMEIDAYNKTLMANLDEQKRKVWIECKEVIKDCDIQYAAMKDASDVIHVMVINSCLIISAPVTLVKITVPVILGIVAMVAAAAAVAGFMVWKNRAPPLPLTDPQYQNIGAEDCTGENPLYKPPTSSFKNPTYGKW